MSPQDKREFQQLLTDAMAFYRQNVSEFALGVWWAACKPFSLDQVRKAFTAHATDPERGQFPPKPADLIRQLQGTHTDRSLLAWGKVYDAAGRVGAYQSVVFDDAAIHAAISDIGGWVSVCRTSEKELPFLQKRFCDAYRAYATRGQFDYPSRLLGEHEIANLSIGQKPAPPVLIGNPAVAGVVMMEGLSGPKTQITHMLESAPAIRRIGDEA